MTDKKPFPLPVNPAPQSIEDDLVASACAGGEPYALMVLGDSMLPEFEEGWVIVVEPNGLAKDGSYVIAWANDEYIFRQLVRHDDGWMLKPLNPLYPNIPVDADLSAVKGVVIMKKKPGRRKEFKSYL
ncbi:S24 family peptidase [Parasulfuritortus cantonensis]|uniref:S24 family peptidase n=1 Tax=Parasulfuritortus cantonensis TaxID=2528202 RepID=A0A4R1B7W0_9PROT|nr:S24 family peptidase [Parasulfuritortus cantonensis]TCJ11869.1 S24 family peptidase [Parasulfuritortus cantonensis]